jgi:hypothetical protein
MPVSHISTSRGTAGSDLLLVRRRIGPAGSFFILFVVRRLLVTPCPVHVTEPGSSITDGLFVLSLTTLAVPVVTTKCINLVGSGVDDNDTSIPKLFASLGKAFLSGVNGPGGVLNDERGEAFLDGINGGVLNAVVHSQSTHEDMSDTGLAQDVIEPAHACLWIAKWRTKGGVRLDALVHAFVQDEIDLVRVEVVNELAADGALHAMIWPQSAGAHTSVYAHRYLLL